MVKAVLNIEDVSLIKKIKKLLKQSNHDWFDHLTEKQQQDVMIGLEELDRGEGIPHEEVAARLRL